MKLRRAREIVARFQEGRVLVIGDCMLDHWIWGTVSRISPEAPIPVVDVERSTYTCGGAANVVHNLCSLGARSGMVGVVGDDDAGSRLRSMLSGQGADVAGLLVDPARPTTTKMRVIAHSQQVVRADTELRAPLDDAIVQALIDAVGDDLADYQGLLVSDYNKGVVSPSVVRAFVDAARRKGIPVVAGPKPENVGLFQNITVIALNEKEAHAATGTGARSEEGAVLAGRDLLRRMGSAAVLITRGDRGMSLIETGRKPHHVPAHARQVYDVSGAGDTVVSVLTLALVAGATMQEAVQLANYAAAVVVQKVGTATATVEEIVEAVRENL